MKRKMLIRINGGAGGIKEYLEDGQKKDRFYTRDELDERVILDGDLLWFLCQLSG